jgi:type I restriction enzyme S subunit
MEARFVPVAFAAAYVRKQIDQRLKSSAGHQRISISDIREILVPLPPLAEQHRIVAEVERRLSVVEQLEATVEANLKRSARLRQAILKRAFDGKLVPQDPDDEPASVLLERVRAQRAERQNAAPARQPRRRKDVS